MLEAQYDISYAIFGKIGQAEASLKVEKDRYEIVTQAYATGVAKLMSNHRVERYSSRGRVVGGRLVPEEFVVLTQKGRHYRALLRYTFDHSAKTVTKSSDITDGKERKQKREKLSYYADDDILTLFFNLRFYLGGKCKSGRCTLRAVGANEKDGRVDIISLGDDNYKVILHRRIFASKQGEMEVHINKMGISDRTLLKDVVFFGDVKAKLTKITTPKRKEKR